MATLASSPRHSPLRGGRSTADRGVIACLFERSPRWRGALRAATELAAQLDADLVLDPRPQLGARRSERVAHVREMARRTGATTLVTSAAGGPMAGFTAPERSPALAAATGLITVLISDRAAGEVVEGAVDGKELVCGIDGSPAAAAAAKVAGALGAKLGMRVHLVHAYAPVPAHVVAPAPGAVAPMPGPELERAARAGAEEILERSARTAGCEALTRLRRGQPGPCLNAYAELFHAPLIVVGAPRRGPLAASLLGSAAWELVRTATRPVVVVPENVGSTTARTTTRGPRWRGAGPGRGRTHSEAEVGGRR